MAYSLFEYILKGKSISGFTVNHYDENVAAAYDAANKQQHLRYSTVLHISMGICILRHKTTIHTNFRLNIAK